MLVVRLARKGVKNSPFYHIVVTDSRKPRDSGPIEKIGYYNPFAKDSETPIRLDTDRLAYWRGVGAQLSERVTFLVRRQARLKPPESEEDRLKDGKKAADGEKRDERGAAASHESADGQNGAERGVKEEEPDYPDSDQASDKSGGEKRATQPDRQAASEAAEKEHARSGRQEQNAQSEEETGTSEKQPAERPEASGESAPSREK